MKTLATVAMFWTAVLMGGFFVAVGVGYEIPKNCKPSMELFKECVR